MHHKTTKSTIPNHIDTFQNCKLNNTHLNAFKVTRICDSEHATKNTKSSKCQKTPSTTQ